MTEMVTVPKRITHKGICQHPQTPYARRKCRAAKIAAAVTAQSAPTIRVIEREHRTRNWRGHDVVTISQHTEITGIVTSLGRTDDAKPMIGHLATYTVDANGHTVTIVNPASVADDMHPVQAGDRIVAIADATDATDVYCSTSITRAA